MTSVPVHVFQSIKQYLAPTADHQEVLAVIATAVSTHRETVLTSDTQVKVVGLSDFEPYRPVTTALDGLEQQLEAKSQPIPNMPSSPRARAAIRLGARPDAQHGPGHPRNVENSRR